jgi:hypothetical protein
MRSQVVRVRNPYYLCLALCVYTLWGPGDTSVYVRQGSLFPIAILHCNKNPIYVFLFWELRILSPNFHIHVSVGDLYILGSVDIFPAAE